MKKISMIFIVLSLFVIGLNFNHTYAVAGDYYDVLTSYTGSDVNKNNANYILDLARMYVKENPQLYSENFTATDSLFDYALIVAGPDNRFSIHFTNDSSRFL